MRQENGKRKEGHKTEFTSIDISDHHLISSCNLLLFVCLLYYFLLNSLRSFPHPFLSSFFHVRTVLFFFLFLSFLTFPFVFLHCVFFSVSLSSLSLLSSLLKNSSWKLKSPAANLLFLQSMEESLHQLPHPLVTLRQEITLTLSVILDSSESGKSQGLQEVCPFASRMDLGVKLLPSVSLSSIIISLSLLGFVCLSVSCTSSVSVNVSVTKTDTLKQKEPLSILV